MTVDKGILIRNLYYMLTYAFHDLRRNNYDDIAGENFDNILDLFAEILFKSVSFQLKRGLHKDYIGNSDTLSTVRGKIDIPGSIRLKMQNKLSVQCEFDDFTEDNIHNRIIKATLGLLTRAKDVKLKRRKKLKSLLMFFSNTGECDLKSVRWNNIRYDRNTSTYRMIHHFCYFVVKKLLLTTDSGKYKVMTFDEELMSRLFEKFVLNYYRRHYPKFSAHAAKVEWNIDNEQSTLDIIPEMRTDIKLTFPDRALIIDTKYYDSTVQIHMNKATVHSNNLYQINTYVFHEDKTHSGKVDGMLLYAKTQEDITPDGQMTHSDGNIIYFRTLDLNKDFGDIRHQLDSLIAGYI